MIEDAPELLLAVDPSTTCTGWAVFADGELIEFGKLKPSPSKCKDWMERVDRICGALEQIIVEHGINVAVIEEPVPFGKGNPKPLFGGFGRQYQTLHRCLTGHVHPITVPRWTHGVPKKRRAARIEAEYTEYSPEEDKGMDIADAIGIGVWFIENHGLDDAD